MKITIGQLTDSLIALTEFANTLMPPQQALRVKRILKVVKKEIETLGEIEKEQAEKVGAMLKHMEDGRTYYDFGTKEKAMAYQDAMKEAKKVEIELPGDPFSVDDINRITAVKGSVLEALDWLITDN